LARLIWTWRKSPLKSRFTRILPTLVFAVCSTVLFTLAGGFSSKISTATGDEVLINGDSCGIAIGPSGNNETRVGPYVSYYAGQLNNAANYAQQCYSANSSGPLDCDRFVIKSLPTAIVDNNASCPFQGDICSSENNVRLDTGYIDSNDHLGLNTPSGHRFALRYILQCAPLKTGGYTSEGGGGNITTVRYHYGSQLQGGSDNRTLANYTYESKDLNSQYPVGGTHLAEGNYILA
jgi:hypothetical protein